MTRIDHVQNKPVPNYNMVSLFILRARKFSDLGVVLWPYIYGVQKNGTLLKESSPLDFGDSVIMRT
jgi:hypothetical protein